MQRMPETSWANASSAPCSLCPPRDTNCFRPFTTMSASGKTFTAALVTYTSSTFTSCAKTARKTVPASGNVPCSTSNSSNRIFFAFLTMPPIIAKATSQSRPKRTPSSSALAQDVQRKDARPSSTTSQMTLATLRTQPHRYSQKAKRRRRLKTGGAFVWHSLFARYSCGSSSWAICTALSAAPLRIWSATTHMARPCLTVGSRRMRPT